MAKTFLEAARELPGYKNDNLIISKNCPASFDFEPFKKSPNCFVDNFEVNAECVACWNRTMPEKE